MCGRLHKFASREIIWGEGCRCRISIGNGEKFSRGTGRNVLRDSRRWGGEEGARRRLLMR